MALQRFRIFFNSVLINSVRLTSARLLTQFRSVWFTNSIWKNAERYLFLGCLRWYVCWFVASGERSTRFHSVFCLRIAKRLKMVTDPIRPHFHQVECLNILLRDNREFLKNAWSITRDLSSLLLLKPTSTNFVLTNCILFPALTALLLFLFFPFDFCCSSRSRMFNWVVLLVVSNGDLAPFSPSVTSCLFSCSESFIFFGSGESSTEEECKPINSRRASAK